MKLWSTAKLGKAKFQVGKLAHQLKEFNLSYRMQLLFFLKLYLVKRTMENVKFELETCKFTGRFPATRHWNTGSR